MSLKRKENVQIGLDSDYNLPIVVLSDNYITAKDKTDTRPNKDFENNIYANFGRSNSVSDEINNSKVSNRKCILFATIAIIILILINLVTLFILAGTKGKSQQNVYNKEAEQLPTAAEQKMDFNDMTPSGPKYTVLDEKANHEAAVQRCAELGATLPMPKSKAENDILDSLTNGGGDFYIALKDIKNEGEWLWGDGTAAEWSNWLAAGEASWGAEPNGGRWENYVIMLKNLVKDEFSHRWADVSPSRTASQVVCQASDVAEYLAGKINRLQKRIRQLENSHEATVMFSAEAAKKVRVPGNGGTAVFETVMAEVGGGYDSETGVFTCPVPGYYYFALHIMAPDDDRADLHLDHNGRIAVRAYAGPGGYNSASASVVLKLASGDVVSVHTYIQPAVLHGGYGSLQGVLLKATL